MLPLSTDDLARMRLYQRATLFDTCVIQTYAGASSDSFGEPVETWTDATSSTPCGLDEQGGSLNFLAFADALTYDASLRLPHGTALDPLDRIKITGKHGETLSVPVVYSIVGPIQDGLSGIRIRLRKVEL